MTIVETLKGKTVYLALSVLVGLTVIWYAIYFPIQGKINHLKKQLATVENQIHEIEGATGDGSPMGGGIKSLVKRYHDLEGKFPPQEEEAIGLLSDFARSFNVEILSVNVQPKSFYLDDEEQKIQIEGQICQRCYVALEMKGSYKSIIKYIAKIEEKLPAHLSIERLRIQKVSSDASKLNVSLGLHLYLLS